MAQMLEPDEFARAILRIRAFVDKCESMPKDDILEELEKMAQDAAHLGMTETSVTMTQMANSLRERFGRGSCQT